VIVHDSLGADREMEVMRPVAPRMPTPSVHSQITAPRCTPLTGPVEDTLGPTSEGHLQPCHS